MNTKETKMNKKVVIPSLCAALVVCSVATFALLPHHHKHMTNINHQGPSNEFVVDGGPMMPPPHFGPHPAMGPGPKFGPHPDMAKILKLTDEQNEKIKKLDAVFHRDMKALRDQGEDVRDTYLEKMDAVLSAEQFRKIQKMRNDLRKEMKKLQNKHENLMEKHRQDFESILTPEQRKILEHQHEQNPNMHNRPERPGAENDKKPNPDNAPQKPGNIDDKKPNQNHNPAKPGIGNDKKPDVGHAPTKPKPAK